MTNPKITPHLNEPSESSPTPTGSDDNVDPRRGLGAPQHISTKHDDLGAGGIADDGIEWTPGDDRLFELRQRVARKSRDQAKAQLDVIRASLEEANRAAEPERRAKEERERKEEEEWARKEEEERRARETVRKVEEARRKEERRKRRVEEERRRVEEERRRVEEERRRVEAREASEKEEATEAKARPVAAEPGRDGLRDNPGIELTLSNFEENADTAGDETAQVQLDIASSSSSAPSAEEKQREAEDEVPEEAREGDRTEVMGERTHLLPQEALTRVPAAAGITRASNMRVDGAAGLDIIAEDGDSNDHSTQPSPAITVEAILADARFKTLNIPSLGLDAVVPNGAGVAVGSSVSAPTMVEEILAETRARALALLSPEEAMLVIKRRYEASGSRAKSAADLTLEEAIILVKNNGANKMGKNSDDNNKAMSSSVVPITILAKEKTKSEEDARDEVKKRGVAVRVKNMQQEVLREEDRAPSIIGDDDATKSIGETEPPFDDKDESVRESIDDLLMRVRNDESRAKSAADPTLEEAIILVKNNGANKMGKNSDDNNKAMSSSVVPITILAKEKTKSEEDARDEVKKRGVAVRVKNMQQEVLREEDRAPSIIGDDDATKSIGETEPPFDDKDESVRESIDDLLMRVRNDSYDQDSIEKTINLGEIKIKKDLQKCDKTSESLEERKKAESAMLELGISDNNASNSGVGDWDDIDCISQETEKRSSMRWKRVSMDSKKSPLGNQDTASNSEDSHLIADRYISWQNSSSSDSTENTSLYSTASCDGSKRANMLAKEFADGSKRANMLAEEVGANSIGSSSSLSTMLDSLASMIAADWERKAHEEDGDPSAVVDNVVITDSEDEDSDDDSDNGEYSTTQEEEDGNLPDRHDNLAFENWDPLDTVVTNSSHRLLALIETLGFGSITSGQTRAMGKRISEDLIRSELGKAREVGLQLAKELTGVNLQKKVSTRSRTDGKRLC